MHQYVELKQNICLISPILKWVTAITISDVNFLKFFTKRNLYRLCALVTKDFYIAFIYKMIPHKFLFGQG